MPVIARFYGIIIKMYFSQSKHYEHPEDSNCEAIA